MTIRRIIPLILTAFLALACRNGQKKVGSVQEKAESARALLFPEVKVPSMMVTEEQRAAFLAEHYWDRFTEPGRTGLCDSLHAGGVLLADVEQHFANYAAFMGMVPVNQAVKAAGNLWNRLLACEREDTLSNVMETLAGCAEKYFYDVNSPYRNEDLYYPFARGLADYEGTDEAMRGKYDFDAQMCLLNRVGTVAADFRFRDVKGRTRRLHQLGGDYILLFFSNPGCQACKAIIDNLKNSARISAMIASGQLSVVNMYIDEDLEAWKSYMPIYPEEWYNVYDPDYVIRTDLVYNVRAIPSLYLLDHEKRVLMKDAVPEKVLWYLENQTAQ